MGWYALVLSRIMIVFSLHVFQWLGWGGSLVLWHEQHQLSLGYAPNAAGFGLLGDPRTVKHILPALFESLHSLSQSSP